MEQTAFKSKLQKEIFFNSAFMAVLVIVGLSLGLFIYYHIDIQRQLRIARDEISTGYSVMVDEVKDRLVRENNNLFAAFIQEDAAERNIFAAYYSFLSDSTATPRGGRLLILDSENNLVFDSYGENVLNRLLALHLSISTENMGKSEFVEQVFLAANRESNLVLLGKIHDEHVRDEHMGYVVFMVSGDSFMPEPSLTGVQYVIFDRHNSIFSRSASLFIQDQIYKIDEILTNRSFRYNQQRFFSQYISLGDNMQLVVYIQDNHGLVLLFVFFIANAFIAAALLIQSKHYSKKITENNIKYIEILTQESERKRLESQFDVHFLFNTLEAARSYVNFNPKLANDIILSLNTILRYSIDEQKTETTIRDDLEYLKYYLEIFKMRFDHFEYSFEVDQQALSFKVPKLLLLPLIENSLKYGFKVRKDLNISVKIEEISDANGKSFHFSVVDNGGGISDEVLAEIKSNESSLHHGLYNSRKRLMLMYPNSTLEVSSKDGGTVVDIVIGE